MTFHSGGYPSEGGARNVKPWSIRGLILQRLDAVIAVNQELAALFRALGVAPSRVRVIVLYAPVALPADVVLPEAIRQFKASHRPLLTVVGGLEKEYDLPTPIEAIDSIRQEFLRQACSSSGPEASSRRSVVSSAGPAIPLTS